MKHCVYRHYDKDDVLLYVGMSRNPIVRLGGHKMSSGWFEQISKVTVDWFDSKREAFEAERVALSSENPKFLAPDREFPVGVSDGRGRPKSMTDKRCRVAHSMLQRGIRGDAAWTELQKLDGPNLSRSTFYEWQKKWDEMNEFSF